MTQGLGLCNVSSRRTIFPGQWITNFWFGMSSMYFFVSLLLFSIQEWMKRSV